MKVLTWVHEQTQGLVIREDEKKVLVTKPVMSFTFDSLYFEPTNKFKVINGERIPLHEYDIAEILVYIEAIEILQIAFCVSLTGEWLGRIEVTPDVIAVSTSPPNRGHYRYDFVTESWVYIHAVDIDGKYIGNVPMGTYADEVPSPPLKDYDRWNFNDAWYDSRSIEDHRVERLKDSKMECDIALRFITEPYPESEMKTWDIQEAEARGTGATPFLDELSLVTGKSIAELKVKIIEKADLFKLISATNIGKRQVMEDAILTATTIDELKAVTF